MSDDPDNAPWSCPRCGSKDQWFDRTMPMATRCSNCGRNVDGSEDQEFAPAPPRERPAAVTVSMILAAVKAQELAEKDLNKDEYECMQEALAAALAVMGDKP